MKKIKAWGIITKDKTLCMVELQMRGTAQLIANDWNAVQPRMYKVVPVEISFPAPKKRKK